MRLAVRGRPVDARLPRYATGLVVLASTLGMSIAVTHFLGSTDSSPAVLTVLVGGVGGWLTAVGGAWKDAPIEGFSGWKFLRSPVVATVWVWVLLAATENILVLAVAAGGLSVMSIETYKTFFTRGRPPGKFGGMPVRFAHHRARETCRALHSGLYLLLASWLAGTLLQDAASHSLLGVQSVLSEVLATVTLALAIVVGSSRPSARRVAADVGLDERQEPFPVVMLGSGHPSAASPSLQESDADDDVRREGA